MFLTPTAALAFFCLALFRLFLFGSHVSLLTDASEDTLETGHSRLRPKDDITASVGGIGECLRDGLADLAALALLLFLFGL